MNYKEFKKIKQEEYNKFPFIFVFTQKDLEKEMELRGIKEKSELINLGAGTIIKKSDYPKLKEMGKRHKEELKKSMQNEKFAKEAFKYELNNYEYIISYNLDDTLESLNLTREDIEQNQMLKRALKEAIKEIEEAYEAW